MISAVWMLFAAALIFNPFFSVFLPRGVWAVGYGVNSVDPSRHRGLDGQEEGMHPLLQRMGVWDPYMLPLAL